MKNQLIEEFIRDYGIDYIGKFHPSTGGNGPARAKLEKIANGTISAPDLERIVKNSSERWAEVCYKAIDAAIELVPEENKQKAREKAESVFRETLIELNKEGEGS